MHSIRLWWRGDHRLQVGGLGKCAEWNAIGPPERLIVSDVDSVREVDVHRPELIGRVVAIDLIRILRTDVDQSFVGNQVRIVTDFQGESRGAVCFAT